MTGIGQMLPLYFTNLSQPDLASSDITQTQNDEPAQAEKITFRNYARNGRSTKSFIAEGRLAVIEKQIAPGDFLFVIFGHNDQKSADPNRFTDPATSFKENLHEFAETAEKHGAFPIFFTPVARRIFDDATKTASDTLKAYSDAMKEFAFDGGYPLVDLSDFSRSFITKLGYEASARLYMGLEPGKYANYPDGRTDNTHLTPDGAFAFAGLCAKGIFEVCSGWNGRNADSYKRLASYIRLPKEDIL